MVQQESSAVDRLYSDFTQIIFQIDASDISLRISAEEIFQKSLYVAIGSHFEQRITECVLEFIRQSSGNSILVTEFARIKGISYQYHTYFDWGKRNANKFFGLFGAEFRSYMTDYVKAHADFDNAVRAFLEIGNMRNEVAHEFGAVSLGKTVDEIYDRYNEALDFIEQIPLRFEEFERSRQTS